MPYIRHLFLFKFKFLSQTYYVEIDYTGECDIVYNENYFAQNHSRDDDPMYWERSGYVLEEEKIIYYHYCGKRYVEYQLFK